MSPETTESTGTVTALLVQARTGDPAAREALFTRVYDELRQAARGLIGRGGWFETPLHGTALVHAACERLLAREKLDAENRRHFFYLFGRAMRDVLVEEARKADADKRGGGWGRVPLVEFAVDGTSTQASIIDLRDALEELRAVDPDSAQVAELRFMGSRTLEETAELMGTTVAAVRKDWEYARAWLSERLSGNGGEPTAAEAD